MPSTSLKQDSLLPQFQTTIQAESSQVDPANFLASIRFGRDQSVYLEPLEHLAIETWPATRPIVHSLENGSVTIDGHRAFINIRIADSTDLAQAAHSAYRSLFDAVNQYQLGNLVRIWNYIPDILGDASAEVAAIDRERYRQFNAGRLWAWGESGPKDDAGSIAPCAATGMGTFGDELVILAITSKAEVKAIENPRQTRTLEYPAKFGTNPPAFARASAELTNQPIIYISGTGSIVGSETLHKNSVTAQAEEIIRNFEAILSPTNLKKYGVGGFKLHDLLQLKVFLKNPSDLAVVKKIVSRRFPNTPVMYLHSQLCRPDLLLEMEAIVQKN